MNRTNKTKTPNRFSRLARFFGNALSPMCGGDAARKTAHARKTGGTRLQIECLESREVLSASPIGPEFELRPDTIGGVTTHDIAMFGDSGFVAAWSGSEGVFTQRYGADNQRIGSKTKMPSSLPYSLPVVRIAANPEGRYAVAWTSPDGDTDMEIRYALFNEAGQATASGQVNTTDGGRVQSSPRIAMDDAGNFTVAFVDEVSSLNTDVYYRRFDRNGVPLGNDAPVPGANQSNVERDPAIAMSAAGRTVISWTDNYYSTHYETVHFTLFDDSGFVAYGDGAVSQFNNSTVDHRNGDVAFDRAGNIYFTWKREVSATNSNDQIVFSVFSYDGSRWYDEYVASESTQISVSDPAIEALAGGGLAIAYYDSNGNNGDVWLADYSDPRTLATRNIIGTDNYQLERMPRLASNGKSYVASFIDKTAGAISNNVMGRIYQGQRAASVGGFNASNGQVYVGHAHPNSSPFLVNHLITTLSSSATWTDMMVGNFDGNDGDELIARNQTTGQWWFTNGLTTVVWGGWAPSVSWVDVKTGDFNADGKADIVGRWAESGQWWAAMSTGTGLVNKYLGAWSIGITWADVRVGDFNGDGRTDIVGRWKETGQWWVARSTGTAFANSYFGAWSPEVNWVDVMAGDVTGDGRADIVGRWKETGQWWVAKSTGTAFGMAYFGAWSVGITWVDVRLADVNGDNVKDLVGRGAENGQWFCGVSRKTYFQSSQFAVWSTAKQWVDVLVGDYNGDGKEEIIARDKNTGNWWTAISTGNSFHTYLWGTWDSNVAWSYVQTVSY